MDKILIIGEAIMVLKETWNSASDIFSKAIPNNFYEIINSLLFLTCKNIGIGANGSFIDKTQKLASSIMGLCSIIMWAVLLFYGFRSLFAYFLSKKVDMPWKTFIRLIVFGILANSAFFISYTGVYFVENITEYIKQSVGEKNVSFSFLEEYIQENDVEENVENLDEEESSNNIYTVDALISLFTYFSSFLVAVCLGGRYVLIKFLILFSPIFFIFGGFKFTEKIFFAWCKKFLLLLFLQIFFASFLAFCNLHDKGNDLISQFLICGMLLVICKNIIFFLKLSH